MSLSFNRILVLGLLSTAVTFAAGNSSTGQATFHLPVEAHWGMAVLEPGDYRMAAPDLTHGQEAFLVRGPQGGVFVLPLVTDTQQVSKRSYLELKRINDTYFVTNYSAGPSGKEYVFSTPKPARHQSLTDGGGTIVAVTNSALP